MPQPPHELWELSARERIRDSLAHYNWSGDAFRLHDLADSFCVDGILEIRDRDPLRGRAEIITFLGGGLESHDDDARRAARRTDTAESGVRRIVRHNVTNVRFGELTTETASVESYFTVFTEIGLDHYGRYRDILVPVADQWLIQHRFVSTDWRAPNSVMARLQTPN